MRLRSLLYWSTLIWMIGYGLQFTVQFGGGKRELVWIPASVATVLAMAVFFLDKKLGFERKANLLPYSRLYLVWIIWKLLSANWSYYSFSTNALPIVDFLLLSLALPLTLGCLGLSFEGKLRIVALATVATFAIGVFLAPIFGAAMLFENAGVDKGSRWFFIHPNIAAQYPLTLLVLLYSWFGWNAVGVRGFFVITTLSVPLVALIAATGSRTSLGAAGLAVLLLITWQLVMRRLSERSAVVAQSAVVGVLIALVLCISFFILYVGDGYLDDITTGRWSFGLELIENMSSETIGEGFLQPGGNILSSIDERGAGIDGAIISILYTQGAIGLVLFALSLMSVAKIGAMDIFSRKAAFVGIPVVLLVAVFETQPFLMGSPLTLYFTTFLNRSRD